MHCTTGNVCVALTCRPPSAPSNYFDALDNALFELNHFNFPNIVLLGDLNNVLSELF